MDFFSYFDKFKPLSRLLKKNQKISKLYHIMTTEKIYQNIVLIEPPTGAKEITSFKYPPMGLLALATYLDKYGYQVSLIDAAVDNLSITSLIEKIKEIKPDLVGISAMSVNIGQTFDLADKIKKYNPDIKIIVGGIHPTVRPEHTLSNKNIDIAIVGEGELTVIELLAALKNNRPLNEIKGLAFRQNDGVIITPRRELIPNLNELPIPLYRLFDLKKYKSPYAKRMPFISMVRSRGCFYNCTFCGNPKMFGQTFRCQSPARTIEEIDYLVKNFGIKEISFKDTELTLDRNLEKLCDLLIARNYDLIWTGNGRVNNINENLLRKMKQAGCYSITYGVESGNQEILNRMKKGITLEQVRKAIDLTKKVGLQIVTNFMIGNAYDTKETIEQTIDLAVELDTDYAYFGFTTPFPGTELREQAEAHNWILDSSMEAIRYDDLMMNATSLSTEELKTYLNKAYRRFYFRPKYILRRLKKLDRYELRNSYEGLVKIIKNNFKIKNRLIPITKTEEMKDKPARENMALNQAATELQPELPITQSTNPKHKIMIIGGAGFIGSRLAKKLIDLGQEVVIYDKFYNFIESEKDKYVFYLRQRLNNLCPGVKIVYGDIRDDVNLLKTIKENQPDTIIHLAQIPLATVSNKLSGEALDININGLTSLIKAIGAVDFIKRLVYSSSSFVYGHFKYAPADENHPTNPIDVYGGTKLACESLIKGFGTRFGIDYTIIRPSAVYGPTDANLRVSQIFVDSAFNGKELVIEGGGEATLDFTYIDDIAQGFVLAALSPQAKNEIFNITRGEGRTLKEFTDILKQYFPDLKTIIKPADQTRPVRGALDIKKAKEILGYSPKYSLEDGIREYVAYIKNLSPKL